MDNNELNFLKLFLLTSTLSVIVGLHTWIIEVYKPSYFGKIGFFGVFAECLIITLILFISVDSILKRKFKEKYQ